MAAPLPVAPTTHRLARIASLRVGASTDPGRVRRRNEDAYTILDLSEHELPPSTGGRLDVAEGGVLLAVADGMGGHANGHIASAMAIASVTRTMRARTPLPMPARLADAFQQAHRDLRAASAGHFGSARMGTTLTAVLIDGTQAHVAHVGDSRAYLVRRGTIRAITKDHTYTEALVDAGLLRESERELSPFPHVLVQALGQERVIEPHFLTLDLEEGDAILLCSDGLTGHVADDEIETVVRLGGPFVETCQALVDLANTRGGEDNVTIVLAGIRGVPPKTDPPPGEGLQRAS